MKTKLLKKIRKQYSIVYYPNGQEPHEFLHTYQFPVYYVSSNDRASFKETKQECLDWILEKVRDRYKKYSVKYDKNKYKPIKVWYKY